MQSIQIQRQRQFNMPGRVEGHPLGDAGLLGDPSQADVAPAVARQVEDRRVAPAGHVAAEDGVGQGEEAHVDLRARLAARGADPESVALLADILRREGAQIDVGEPREAAEEEGVAHERRGRMIDVEPYEAVDLLHGEVVAHD